MAGAHKLIIMYIENIPLIDQEIDLKLSADFDGFYFLIGKRRTQVGKKTFITTAFKQKTPENTLIEVESLILRVISTIEDRPFKLPEYTFRRLEVEVMENTLTLNHERKQH